MTAADNPELAATLADGAIRVVEILRELERTVVPVDTRLVVWVDDREAFAEAIRVLGPEAERKIRPLSVTVSRKFGPVRLDVTVWAGALMPAGRDFTGYEPIEWPDPAEVTP